MHIAIASVAMGEGVGDTEDLSVAVHCSDIAGRLALEYFLAGVQATVKDDGSPVTEADLAVEDLLRTELGRLAPHDAFLGEESGSAGESERVWILDPIDGTSFFSRGSPHWRVHVALAVRGRVEVAVVTAPALGRQWRASRGHGAFESSWPHVGRAQPLAVTRTAALGGALLAGDVEATRAALGGLARVTPPSTSGWCQGLMQLVRGEIDGFVSDGHKVWDHAPWILLVEESGGRFTKRVPTEVHGGGLYSNALLHEALVEAVRYPPTR